MKRAFGFLCLAVGAVLLFGGVLLLAVGSWREVQRHRVEADIQERRLGSGTVTLGTSDEEDIRERVMYFDMSYATERTGEPSTLLRLKPPCRMLELEPDHEGKRYLVDCSANPAEAKAAAPPLCHGSAP